MKDIDRVHMHYLETDGLLSALESDLDSTTIEREKWSLTRVSNDQAYFALIFAQFEDFVNKSCKSLIGKMQLEPSWKLSRAWDVIDLENLDRFSFMNRVALLTEKGETDYNVVKKYYTLRCKIDHGENKDGIAVTAVGDDLFNIATRMRLNID